jgi:hypothetical protein
MRILHILKTALVLALVTALCSACTLFVSPKPAPTTDAPATSAATTADAAPTETQPVTTSSPAAENDLLDFALLDRLFSMTYADFCREEGRRVEPEGIYDGGAYCYFSKYGDSTPFFFDAAWDAENPKVNDPENNLLNTASFKASDLLPGKQSVTLGELKRWLGGKGIECTAEYSEFSDSIRFCFESGKYEIMGDLDSENDDAPIKGFEVYCKGNYDN